MTRFATPLILASLLAMGSYQPAAAQEKPVAPEAKAEKETRYLAFQIFTYYSPDPKVAALLSSGSKERLLPGKAALRDYVLDIKQRIGTVGDRENQAGCHAGAALFRTER